jgi:hypothetical protein
MRRDLARTALEMGALGDVVALVAARSDVPGERARAAREASFAADRE